MAKEYITQVEFAKRNSVSQQAIGKHVRAGKLPLKDGKIIMPDAQYAYDEIKRNNTQVVTENTEKAIGAGT